MVIWDVALTSRALARSAARIVDELQAIYTRMGAALRRAGYFDTVVRSYDTRTSLSVPDWAEPIVTHAFLAHHHWRKTGVMYTMHPDLVVELSDLAGSRMPTGILDHLPHLNPLLIYPDPIPCISANGTAGELVAAYILGDDQGMIVDTTDPHTRGLQIGIMIRLPDQGPEYFVMPIRRAQQWYDADHEIQRMARKWTQHAQLDPTSPYNVDTNVNAHSLRTVVTPVLDALTYVCSIGADIKPPLQPNTTTNRNARRRQRRNLTTPQQPMLVGYREGPTLAAQRRYANQHHHTLSAGTVKPHPRRGYYAIRWTQPGRTVPRNTLIRPTYVNRHKLADQPPPPTVIHVEQVDD